MNKIMKEIIEHNKKWSDPEYCLQAVKDDPENFSIVRVQTPEMCKIAVDHNPRLLADVKNQTPELCVEAIKKWRLAYIHIRLPKTEPERTDFLNRLNELLIKNDITELVDEKMLRRNRTFRV